MGVPRQCLLHPANSTLGQGIFSNLQPVEAFGRFLLGQEWECECSRESLLHRGLGRTRSSPEPEDLSGLICCRCLVRSGQTRCALDNPTNRSVNALRAMNTKLEVIKAIDGMFGHIRAGPHGFGNCFRRAARRASLWDWRSRLPEPFRYSARALLYLSALLDRYRHLLHDLQTESFERGNVHGRV